MQAKNNQYWATIEDHIDLLGVFDEKIKTYHDDIRETGILDLWERSFRAYYGGRTNESHPSALFEAAKLRRAGVQGEKTRLKANHYRNLIRHSHQLATQQKPNMQARASNTDYKSQSQTILANGLLDYYWREKGSATHVRNVTEVGILYGEGFVHAPWNPSAGEIYMTDGEGRPIYEGDQEYQVHTPINVIRDPAANSDKISDWIMIRDQQNRWNLAAKYSAQAEAIIEAAAVDPHDDNAPSFNLRGGNEPKNDDLLNVYTFYHRKSEAIPQGRMVIFIKEMVLFDGPLPYSDIPVYRLCAEQLLDTIYGYTFAFDLLGVQEGIDELHTILMSNNKTFGIQSLWVKDTDKVSVSQLSGGMRLLKSEEAPQPIQLTKSAAESYTYLDKLEQTAETLSGISSTVRGQPEASLKSGTALALVVSQSIQFQNNLEAAVNKIIEDMSTGLIYNLRDFSKTKRVANIIGESSRPFAETFVGQDLAEINRVTIEQASPLSKTVAGKVEIANNLLQQGFIKTPEQYLMVLSTGQLDPAIEGTTHSMLNIRAENEALRKGEPIQALMTEDHATHIREHKCVIENPEAKKNPQLITNVLNHIQEHLQLWRTADPAVLMITGQQPPPPPPMPMGAPGAVMSAGEPVTVQDVPLPNMPGLPLGASPEAQEAYDKINPTLQGPQ